MVKGRFFQMLCLVVAAGFFLFVTGCGRKAPPKPPIPVAAERAVAE